MAGITYLNEGFEGPLGDPVSVPTWVHAGADVVYSNAFVHSGDSAAVSTFNTNVEFYYSDSTPNAPITEATVWFYIDADTSDWTLFNILTLMRPGSGTPAVSLAITGTTLYASVDGGMYEDTGGLLRPGHWLQFYWDGGTLYGWDDAFYDLFLNLTLPGPMERVRMNMPSGYIYLDDVMVAFDIPEDTGGGGATGGGGWSVGSITVR